MRPQNVVLLQLDAARQQRAMFDEALDRLEHAGAQTGFMGAAGHRRNQVDIGFATPTASTIPADHPRRALAMERSSSSIGSAYFSPVNSGATALAVVGQFSPDSRQAVRIAPVLRCWRRRLVRCRAHFDAGQQHRLERSRRSSSAIGTFGDVEDISRSGQTRTRRAAWRAAASPISVSGRSLAAAGKTI